MYSSTLKFKYLYKRSICPLIMMISNIKCYTLLFLLILFILLLTSVCDEWMSAMLVHLCGDCFTGLCRTNIMAYMCVGFCVAPSHPQIHESYIYNVLVIYPFCVNVINYCINLTETNLCDWICVHGGRRTMSNITVSALTYAAISYQYKVSSG